MSDVSSSGSTRPVYEVEFTIRGSAYPFVEASRLEECTFELAEMLPPGDGRYAEFFNVTGVETDRIVELASAHGSVDVSLLREYERGGLFEFLVSGNCPAFTLAELGALPREVTSVDGEGRIVAEIPTHYDPSRIVEAFLEENSDAELVAKRRKDSFTPLFTDSAFQQVLNARFTDRQREVLQAAFEAGYYEWPRKCTGTDVAETLGITSATFSEHIHTAERKLLTILFERCR